jgi:hypothetical protein
LAAATIRLQMHSGRLSTILHNLANADMPAEPPSFAAVVAQVETIKGVRFQSLFERLPHTVPDGDAAIAAVWQLVKEQKEKSNQPRPDMDQLLRESEPLLQAIVAVAKRDESLRAELEAMLLQLEENGWKLTDAVQRIWAGERDAKALTAGVDPNSAQVVHRVLQLLAP